MADVFTYYSIWGYPHVDQFFNKRNLKMSIQKNTPNYLVHNGLSFTTIINETIDLINDLGALGLYCYLSTKPPQWNISVQHLSNYFLVGRDTIRKKIAHLKEIGLIKIEPVRCEKGRILHWETTLINHVPHVECKKPASSRLLKNQKLEKPETGKYVTSNKRDISNKRKRESARVRAPALSTFLCPALIEEVLSNEAVRIMGEKQLEQADVFARFQAYARSKGWRRKDWKSSFLKWCMDERSKTQTKPKQSTETRSTAQFWGPGHPSYDALYGKGATQ